MTKIAFLLAFKIFMSAPEGDLYRTADSLAILENEAYERTQCIIKESTFKSCIKACNDKKHCRYYNYLKYTKQTRRK